MTCWDGQGIGHQVVHALTFYAVYGSLAATASVIAGWGALGMLRNTPLSTDR